MFLPVVAPAGTTAVTFTLVTNVNAAAVPLNFTEFTPREVRPWMVTVVPTLPLGRIEARERGSRARDAEVGGARRRPGRGGERQSCPWSPQPDPPPSPSRWSRN